MLSRFRQNQWMRYKMKPLTKRVSLSRLVLVLETDSKGILKSGYRYHCRCRGVLIPTRAFPRLNRIQSGRRHRRDWHRPHRASLRRSPHTPRAKAPEPTTYWGLLRMTCASVGCWSYKAIVRLLLFREDIFIKYSAGFSLVSRRIGC